MTTTTNTKTPFYATLCNEIAADLRDAGCQLIPQVTTIHGHQGNKGWACFQRTDGQKIYVSRSDRNVIIHTTLSVDPQTPGYIDPKGKAPGKIEAFFTADIDLVRQHLIPLFLVNTTPLRADRVRASSPASSPGAPAIRVGTLDDLNVPETMRLGSMDDLTS